MNDEPTLQELGYTTVENERMGKVRRFVFHFSQGYRDRFPICCVLRFSLEMASQDGKTYPIEKSQGIKRGSVKRADGSIFVPCNVFHHKTEDH